MSIFDLTTKAGFPDGPLSVAYIPYTNAAAAEYFNTILIDTENDSSFYIDVFVRTENASAGETAAITGTLNLQESDNDSTGFENIPYDRIINTDNLEFYESENSSGDTYIDKALSISAYGCKRYIKFGGIISATRTDTTSAHLVVLPIYCKNTGLTPYTYLID